MKKILTIIGARPQFVKAAAVSRALKKLRGITERILHTGQHFDIPMSDVFFKELGIPKPYKNLNVANTRGTGDQTGRMIIGIEKEITKVKPDLVLVFGDTNSTLSAAIAASKAGIPLAHIEAGLRSFNLEMPEEINRIVTDRLSTVLFAPTTEAVRNLKSEGISKNVHQVGDVMIDAIRLFSKKADRIPEKATFPNNPYFVLTIHRQSNTDNKQKLKGIITALAKSPIPFAFPIHPRTKKAIKKFKIQLPDNVYPFPPLSYLEMVALQKNAQGIWTDSGGMQKEAAVLGVPCFTLRNETEWVETEKSGWNKIVGDNRTEIEKAVKNMGKHFNRKRKPFPTEKHYGNGRASEAIAKILRNVLQ